MDTKDLFGKTHEELVEETRDRVRDTVDTMIEKKNEKKKDYDEEEDEDGENNDSDSDSDGDDEDDDEESGDEDDEDDRTDVGVTESAPSIPTRMVRQYERLAKSERRGGGKIDIDYRLPTVYIKTSARDEYFFQEHEAQDLLDTVPQNIAAEDFLLAQSQNW